MRALLNVNVLLALFDASHEFHTNAQRWLHDNLAHGWASCAITQNGLVRILSQPRYPGANATRDAIARMGAAANIEHHQFWRGGLSITDPDWFD